jgi:hypothetical protein
LPQKTKKMENREINSIGDLRSEIIRLQAEADERELIIKQELDEITEQIKAPFQFVKKAAAWLGIGEQEEKKSSDWVTMLAQLGFPYLLNSVFFKRSGLILKGLVALLSQKAASSVNSDTISEWVEKITHWIKSQKDKKGSQQDYGIPPDSETY